MLFETEDIEKEKSCSGTEIPLEFPGLLAEAAEILKQKGLRLSSFQDKITVPSRLSNEAIDEICSRTTRIAQKFASQHRCRYLGGTIFIKDSLSSDDNGRDELCKLVVKLTGA